MPIHECTLPGGGKGFQWGGKGKCYPTRAEAEKQAQAAYSNGYTGDEDTLSLTDSFVLDGIHRSKDGYLAAYANVARTGIQTYKGRELGRPDLGDVKVYRPPEEVFNKDAMHSMAHRPVTLHHPTETVNARNWKKYAKGHTGDEVIRDGDHIRVPVVVMDAETIQAFENKDACELSMGYSTDLKWTPGETPDGQTYDAVQTAIRANHLAIVPVARGGSTLKLGDDLSFRDLVASINDNVIEMEDDEACPYCGEDVEPGDLVCPHCGADLDEDDDVTDAVELEDEHLQDFNPNHDPQTGRFTSAENIAAAGTLKSQHGVSFRAEGVGKATKFYHKTQGGIEHGPFDIYSRAINHAAGVVGVPNIQVPEVENLSRKERRKQLRATKNALTPYSGGPTGIPGLPRIGGKPTATPGRFTSKQEAKEHIQKNRRIWRNARVVTTVEKTKEPFHVPKLLGGEPLGYGLSSLGIAHKNRKEYFHVHHDGIQDEQLDDGECSIVFDADNALQDECLEDSLIDVIDGDPIYLDDYDPSEPRDPRGRWTEGEGKVLGYNYNYALGGPNKGHFVANTQVGFNTGGKSTRAEAFGEAFAHMSSRGLHVIAKNEQDLKHLGYKFETAPDKTHSVSKTESGFQSGPHPTRESAVNEALAHSESEQERKYQIRNTPTTPNFTTGPINPKTSGHGAVNPGAAPPAPPAPQAPTPPAPQAPAIYVPPVLSVAPELKTQAGSPYIVRRTPTSFENQEEARKHIAKELAYWKSAKVLHQKVVEKTPYTNPLGLPGFLGGRKLGNYLAGHGIAKRSAPKHYYSIVNNSRDSAVTDAANDDGIGNNIGEIEMAKMITIDGIPVETTDVGASVIQRHLSNLEGQIKTLQDAWNDKKKKDDEEEKMEDGLKKQVEAKDGEIAVLKKQLADAQLSPEKLDVLVKDRSQVIDSARTVLDSQFVFDGKKVEDIRRAAVSAKLGDVKDMSDAAIEGAFKALTLDAKVSNGGTRPLARALFDQRSNAASSPTDVRDAALMEREKYLNNAWRGQSGNGNAN